MRTHRDSRAAARAPKGPAGHLVALGLFALAIGCGVVPAPRRDAAPPGSGSTEAAAPDGAAADGPDVGQPHDRAPGGGAGAAGPDAPAARPDAAACDGSIGCSVARGEGDPDVADAGPGSPAGLAWPSGQVDVCWETEGFASEKDAIVDAVNSTWEAEGKVTFSGWTPCPGSAPFSGIRVKLAAGPSSTKAFGRLLSAIPDGLVIDTWQGRPARSGRRSDVYAPTPSGSSATRWGSARPRRRRTAATQTRAHRPTARRFSAPATPLTAATGS